MTELTPFADKSTFMAIAKMTIENSTDRIALYGSLDLTQERQGLAHARALKAILDQTVQVLEAQENLPEAVPAAATPKTVANPFE